MSRKSVFLLISALCFALAGTARFDAQAWSGASGRGRPSILRDPQGRPEQGRGATGSGQVGGRGPGAAQTLGEILATAGLGDNRLKVVVQEGGRHNEASWASRFPDALAFLFRK